MAGHHASARRSTVSSGFDSAVRALATVRGFSGDERQTLVAFLKLGRARVATPREGAATTLTILADHAFTWPEFDRWQAFFAARGAFPARWEGLQAAPAFQTSQSARVAYQLRKLDLLVEWLDRLARGAAALGHYTKQGMRARIVRQGDGQRCPACESWEGREVRHGKDTVPPIHPGCRCVLMAVSAASRARA